MVKTALRGIPAVAALAFFLAAGLTSVSGQSTEIVSQVAASTDDAYDDPDPWWPGYSDTATATFIGTPSESGPVTSGFRFTGLGIPEFANILSAHVEFNQSGWGWEIPTTLSFESAGDPATFSSSDSPLDRTANLTDFNLEWTWDRQSPGSWHETPSLAAGIQELVDDFGGIDTAVLLETGLPDGVQGQYHNWVTFDGDPTRAPILRITWEQGSDTAPPEVLSHDPVGDLPEGTTAATINVQTDESAVCRYDTTAGIDYQLMTGVFDVTGTASHSFDLSGLITGIQYNYFVRCEDVAGNPTTTDYLITFRVLGADVFVPISSNGQPTGTLPSETSQTDLQLDTDENAICRYSSVPGEDFTSALMTDFVTTGGRSHSTLLTGLTGDTDYDFYVRCQDSFGNTQTTDFVISFSVAPDTTAPIISSPSPTGLLPAGTTAATLEVSTHETATCRVDVSPGTSFASMSGFATTGGTTHQTPVGPLVDGGDYAYYVKCEDAAANQTVDFEILFSVAVPGPVSAWLNIAQSSDDGYEDPDSWPNTNFTSGGIYAGQPGSGAEGSDTAVVGGWRWQGVDIPENAIILDVYVEFTQNGWGFSTPTLLSFQDELAPATFSGASSPYDRWASRVQYEKAWTWVRQSPGSVINSPSLRIGVQQLVNNNAGATDIVLLENGSPTTPGEHHSWTSFDNDPALAARLYVEYLDPSIGVLSVPENSLAGTIVGSIGSTVSDDALEGLTYAEKAGGLGETTFTVDPATGEITVEDPANLDFELNEQMVYEVELSDSANTVTVPVLINLINLDEGGPIVTDSGPFSVPENSAPGTSVDTVVASDPDLEPISFTEIAGGAGESDFEIDSITGEITVQDSVNFDRELNEFLDYDIEVTDGTNPVLLTVRIDLTGVNEFVPVIVSAGPFTIDEHLANGLSVGSVVVTDDDLPQELLTFTEAAGGAGETIFSIDSTTGEITVEDDTVIDFEVAETFFYDVEVSDGLNTVPQTVQIDLLPVNEFTPVFDVTGPFSITENSPVGAVVGLVEVSDADSPGDLLTIAEVAAGSGAGVFDIDSSTGEITVQDPANLDFESASQVEFDVEVSDGTFTTQTTIIIELLPLDDNLPVFDPVGPVAINENSPVGTSVVQVSATDADLPGDTLQFTEQAGGAGESVFQIDPNTGLITIEDPATLDRETVDSVVYDIQVSDGTSIVTLSVSIDLLPINEFPPIFTASGPFDVDEHSPIGTAVDTAAATDDDLPAETLTFSEISGGAGEATFAIDPVSGAITVENPAMLDTETNPTLTYDIQVSDGTFDVPVTVTINITDINETPVADGQAVVTDEDVPLFIVLTGSDIDGDTLTFIPADPPNGTVTDITQLTPTSAQVTYTPDPFYNGPDSFIFTVFDGELTSTAATVSITVNGSNSTPPYFTGTGPFSVAENAILGTSAGAVVAEDDDVPADTLIYSEIAGGAGEDTFAIDPVTGAITVEDPSALDFETVSSLTYEVQVFDGTFDVSTTVTIDITPVNDNAPVFTVSGPFSAPENSINGTPIDSVAANDDDLPGDVLVFSEVAGGAGENSFEIDPVTGAITVEDPSVLDYETVTSLTYDIQVSDGLFDVPTTVTIDITPLNDNAPVFTASGPFTLPENSPATTLVGTVEATDNDLPPDTLTFSEIPGGAGEATFAIDPVTGEITVENPGALDYETTPFLTYDIQVSDGASDVPVTVTIDLTPLNDNAPVFIASGPYSVDENSTAGTNVGTVIATDDDLPAETLAFSEIAGGAGETTFAIDPVTGQITVEDPTALDSETDAFLAYDIEVSDGGFTTPITVTININPLNEFAPVFTESGPFSIPENSVATTAVGTVTASDGDLPLETLSFSEVSGGAGEATFAIDPVTGEITVEDPTTLDYETVTSLLYDIEVSDGLSNVPTTVNVNLTSVNDNVPTFTASGPFDLPENSPADTPVGSVAATDADLPTETLIFSEVAGGSGELTFAIDSSGNITVEDPAALDTEIETSLVYAVQVFDGENTVVTFLLINLIGVQDNIPVWTFGGVLNVAENSPNGTSVGVATATDADVNPADTLTFTEVAGGAGENVFDIDPVTGLVSVQILDGTLLDAESVPSFDYDIEVTDGTTTVGITASIVLIGVNEFPPAFVSTGPFEVIENSPVGSLVDTVVATDPDLPEETLIYSEVPGGAGETVFNIDALTGEISVEDSSVLDRETISFVNYEVQVTDGLTAVTRTFTINLLGENDHAPIIVDSGPFNVDEGAPIGTSVGVIDVNDIDVPLDNISFSEIVSGSSSWPLQIDLAIGESADFVRSNGTTRTIKLLDYQIIIPNHLVEATVEVTGGGRTEQHTMQVTFAGTPVVVNGLRIYAYAWKEANDGGFEPVGQQGDFPLTEGKDIGFAVNDAAFSLFPDMDDFVYPLETAFHEGEYLQTWLDPDGWAHSGFDLGVHGNVPVLAPMDGYVWYQYYAGQGQLWITENNQQYGGGACRIFTHIESQSQLLPQGSFVTKGTPLNATVDILSSGNYYDHYHAGSCGTNDFGSWLFYGEVWNNQHQTDYPAPRYWLGLGAYNGDLNTDQIALDESGDLPVGFAPQVGDLDLAGSQSWVLTDNFVNSTIRVGEVLSDAPFSGYSDRLGEDSVGYMATYIFSPEDYTGTQTVHLKFGANHGARVWLNDGLIHDATEARYFTYDPNLESPIEIDKYDYVLELQPGWNTLVIKTSHGSRNRTAWLVSPKIGDSAGNAIPGIYFSTRDIGLTTTPVSGGSVQLNWSAQDFHGVHVDSYLIDVATDPGFTEILQSNLPVGDVSTYTMAGLADGVTYYFRVKPYNRFDLGGTAYLQHSDMAVAVAAGIESVPISQSTPGDIEPDKTPVFLVLGSDDNHQANGINWFVDELLAGRTNPAGAGNPATFDGQPARMSFYIMGELENRGNNVANAIRDAYDQGHELGNHAYLGFDGNLGSQAEWLDSLSRTNDFLTRPVGGDGTMVTSPGGQQVLATGIGMPLDEIYGFRTPLDQYNDDLFPVLSQMGFLYHSSSAQGHSSQSIDGSTDLYWPGTLESGIPYATAQSGTDPIPSTPGLWELAQNWMKRPASLGGQDLLYCDKDWFSAYDDDPPEVMADNIIEILKHNLDLHIAGNRTPLHLCLHSQEWDMQDWQSGDRSPTVLAKQRILTEFLDYALSQPDVRVVRQKDVIDWVRNPVPLDTVEQPELSPFSINASTGEITVRDNAELDYETGSSPFSYVIQVFDGLNVVPVTVTIDLNPINDNAPIFDPVGPFSIAEDALLGAVVGSVSATDADLPADTLTFSEIAGGAGETIFAIDPISGQITLEDPSALDFDTAPVLTYDIQVSDGVPGAEGTFDIPITLTIDVLDTNDNPPVFTDTGPYTVPENSPVGTPVGTVVATDADALPVLTYSEIPGGSGEDVFAIDPVTGAITVQDAAELDIEKTPSFAYDIQVSDGLFDTPATVTVDLSGENDNAPVFVLPGPVTVAENAAPGSVVFAPQSSSALEWLSADGNRIVNESGETVVLRGVNLENREWLWDIGIDSINYELEAIPEAIKVWGGNVILLAFASGPVNRGEADYLAQLDRLTAAIADAGAYALLVYRYPEPNTVPQPGMPDQAAEDAIATLAARYSTNPAVLYGLQVEPDSSSAADWVTDLLPRFTTMVDAIRANNPNSLVFVPGSNWSKYVFEAIDNPVPRSNIVYKTHTYDPWSVIQSDYRLDEVAQLYPILIGEFGTGAVMTQSDVDSLLGWAETNGISWTAWLFNDAGAPTLLDDRSTFTPTAPYGDSIKARLQEFAGRLAVDIDVPGDLLTYTEIAGGAGELTFAIDPLTGEITVQNPTELDYETTTSLTYDIQVSDGLNDVPFTVIVNLLPVDDFAPVFTVTGPFSVDENSVASTTVGTVVATDDDLPGDTLTYSETSGGAGEATFAIDPVTGEITVEDPAALDAETTASLTYDVQVSDGVTDVQTSITIDINPISEFAPVFAVTGPFSVPENSIAGTAVGSVTATDDDAPGDTLTFTEVAGGAGEGTFDIDASGNITVEDPTPLDFETTTSLTYDVQVSDGTFDVPVTVTIDITPVNDNAPVFTVSGPFSLPENSPATTSVGTVTATDDDLPLPGDTLTFTEIAAGAGHETFAVDPATGEITVEDPTLLDYETVTSMSYDIQVSDGTFDVPVTVTVDLTPLDDNAPVFTVTGPFNVDENSVAGTAVGAVVATDDDLPGDTLTYTEVAGGAGEGTFAIDAAGNITVEDPAALDREFTDFLTYDVQVSDGVTDVQTTVTININPISEFAPVFTITGPFSVPENSATGTPIGTVTATDDDAPGDLLTITEVSGGAGEQIFSIDASGNITVQNPASLDYETTTSFTYDIQVSDGVFDVPVTVTIDITDVNEPPSAIAQEVTASENTPLVILLTGFDIDADALTFLPAAPAVGTLSAVTQTTPDSAEVTYTPGLDYIGPDSFTFTVSDGEFTSDAATVTVTVVAADSTPPYFTGTGPFSVLENSTAGTTVGSVSAADDDLPADTLTFTEIAAGAGHDTFAIDPVTGEITVQNPTLLDYETSTSLTYDIQVSDGTFDVPATVTIDITPVNDIAPVFTVSGPFAVDENSISGTSVGTVAATDGDLPLPADTLTFTEIAGGAGESTFAIDPVTGEITVENPAALDYETSTSLTYDIQVSDADFDVPVTVTVNVNDINEAPEADAQGVSTGEDTPLLILLTGSDVDGDALTFVPSDPANGSLSSVTQITPTSAEVTYTPDLNYSGPDSFTFTVFDGEFTSTAATVSISVGSENDPPEFTVTGPFSIDENSIAGTTVGTVEAKDADLPPDTLTFTEVSGGAGEDDFNIDPVTGEITVEDPLALDFETTSSLTYDIQVSDGAFDVPTTVTININALNDNLPVFGSTGPFSVDENSPAGTSVGTVTATDDEVPPDTLTFSEVAGGAGEFAFAIDPVTGEITVEDPAALDAETAASLTYDIQVSDGTFDVPASITVDINDVNEAPVANGQAVSTNEDAPLLILLTGTDVDGDALTFVPSAPANGGLSAVTQITPTSAEVTYTPDLNYSGPDSFTFTVFDGEFTNPAAIVTIDVGAENDPPVFTTTGPFSIPENSAVGTPVGTVSATDADVPADTLTFSEVPGGTGETVFNIDSISGLVTVEDSGALDFETTPSLSYDIQVSDGTVSVPTTVIVDLSDVGGINGSVDVQIAASADDAFDDPAPHWPGYSHIQTTNYAGNPGSSGPATAGYRFTGLEIPAGATITNAYVEFTQSGWGYEIPTVLTLQSSASPTTFDSTNTPLDRLGQATSFSLQWTWDRKNPGTQHQTPSIAAGIQELIDTYGTITSVVVLESGIPETPNGQYHNWTTFDGNPLSAARLIVEYTVDGDPGPLSATTGGGSSIALDGESGHDSPGAATNTSAPLQRTLLSRRSRYTSGRAGAAVAAEVL